MAEVVVELEVLGPYGGSKQKGQEEQGAGAGLGCAQGKCGDLHMQMI
jgi:hypothetical protein